jgi:hypothetical protein
MTKFKEFCIAFIFIYIGLILWKAPSDLWKAPFDKENLPFFGLLGTTIFSTLTAVFAYLAYGFSKEKFRLDLFDKRFAIYEETLKFCSQVMAEGSAKEKAIMAAEGSFRGIGYHKAQALFGEDIHELFSRLNKSYAWLSAFAQAPSGSMTPDVWARAHTEQLNFIWDTANKLPELFRSYMYFGDYKRD